MHIESNIADVIGRVERLKRAIPQAMQKALEPARWEQPAIALAERTLLSLAQPQERQFIPGFIKTIVVGVFGGEGEYAGLQFRMSKPPPELKDVMSLGEARAARGVSRASDLAMGLFDKPVFEFQDLILRWVQTSEEEGGKARDARDWGKSDEDIASLIAWIMLSPEVEPGSKAEAARKALQPHIEAFLQQNQVAQLSPDTVHLWLTSVLAVWRELVRVQYPGMVRMHLRQLMAA